MINDPGSEQLSIEGLRLYDQVMALTSAIQEAIIRGQRSVAVLDDVRESSLCIHGDLTLTRSSAGPGVVGWADDF
jgi:hypothetical protein